MQVPETIPWKRLTAEGVAIIVSILLAFWIDAWWDGLQERENERAILTALQAEFQQIRRNVDDIQKFQGAMRDSALRLVELSVETDRSVTDRELDHLLEQQLWVSTPTNFSAPELNAAISRGDLVLVSNRDLRSRLQSWPAKFQWIVSAMQGDLDFSNSDLARFFFENTSFIQLIDSSEHRPGDPTFSRPERSFNVTERISHRDLLQNRQLQNLLLTRVDLLDDVISLARDDEVPERLDETIELIERELSR